MVCKRQQQKGGNDFGVSSAGEAGELSAIESAVTVIINDLLTVCAAKSESAVTVITWADKLSEVTDDEIVQLASNDADKPEEQSSKDIMILLCSLNVIEIDLEKTRIATRSFKLRISCFS
ncbi:hypothetical protein AVEN_39935-1 [Araneus ventricosus]|uniref:Uncharacterized protein n=1 Tax=Araneus ventricosus TaxID=182803 RepID=A0A4Y2G292_ARAVE|nr:hypothetical protein AVEN_39935-1 [Araneus ventricosus]